VSEKGPIRLFLPRKLGERGKRKKRKKKRKTFGRFCFSRYNEQREGRGKKNRLYVCEEHREKEEKKKEAGRNLSPLVKGKGGGKSNSSSVLPTRKKRRRSGSAARYLCFRTRRKSVHFLSLPWEKGRRTRISYYFPPQFRQKGIRRKPEKKRSGRPLFHSRRGKMSPLPPDGGRKEKASSSHFIFLMRWQAGRQF